jgi:poly(beta-D-mannuronate) lyase
MPLFNDAKGDWETFGTDFKVFANRFTYAKAAAGNEKTMLKIGHWGYNPPGKSYLFNAGEGHVMEAGTVQERRNLLKSKCGIDASRIRVFDNIYENRPDLMTFTSMATFGAASEGWDKTVSITDLLEEKPAPQDMEVLLSDDFRDLSNWKVHEDPGTSVEAGSGGARLFDDSGSGFAQIGFSAGRKLGFFYFRASFRFREADKSHFVFLGDGSAGSLYLVNAYGDGTWRYYDGSKYVRFPKDSAGYSAGPWYKVEVLADFKTGRFSVWINGSRVGESLGIPGSSSYLTGLRIQPASSDGRGGLWVDDARFSEVSMEPELRPADTQPPALAGLSAAAVSSQAAVCRWASGEPASSKVEFGTSPAYGRASALMPALSTCHAVSLTGLAPGATYYWRALSADDSGNLGTSPGPAFKTLPPSVRADNALFWSQSVSTFMATGARRAVSVTMVNAGTAAWTREGGYRLGSQNPRDNRAWGLNRVELDEGEAVAPGQKKTFAFHASPQSTGTLSFQWRMVREGAHWFGDPSPETSVRVVDGAPPEVSIAAPAAGSVFSEPQTVLVAAKASDGVGVAEVRTFLDGALYGTGTVHWPITYDDNGVHVWTAMAFDAAGNSSTSPPVSVTVDIDPFPKLRLGCADLRSRYGAGLPCELKFDRYRGKDPRLVRMETSGYGAPLFNGVKRVVSSAAQINALKLKPGDQVVLKNGVWTDQSIAVRFATGTFDHPILFRPESPGGVTLTGASQMYVDGRNVIVDGLKFAGGRPRAGAASMTVLQMGSKARPCDACIVRGVTVDDFNAPDAVARSTWVKVFFLSVAGKDDTVADSIFKNKLNCGKMLAAEEIPAHGRGYQRLHVLGNTFQDQPHLSGENGFEAVQLGYSGVVTDSAYSVFEGNTFERASGEIETVAVKISDVIFRKNVFRANYGMLSLRACNRVLLEDNLFDGSGLDGMGGVRVTGAGHWIAGNRLENLRKPAGSFLRPIVLQKGDVEDLEKDNPAYSRVKDAAIVGNVFLDDDKGILIGAAGSTNPTLSPKGVFVERNSFRFHPDRYDPAFQPVAFANGADPSGVVVASNTVEIIGDNNLPPVLSGLEAVEVSSRSALLRWTTNKRAGARVEFGPTRALWNSVQDSLALSTGHAVLVEGLAPAATYYWKAVSIDPSGRAAEASGPAFATRSPFADVPGVPEQPTLAANANLEVCVLREDWLDRAETAWMRAMLPAIAFIDGSRSLDSDKEVARLKSLSGSGKKLILTIKWNLSTTQTRVPAPGSAQEARWLSWVSDLVDAMNGRMAVLVAANEFYPDTMEADRSAFVEFQKRLVRSVSLKMKDMRSKGTPPSFELYSGGFTRLHRAETQKDPDVLALIELASSDMVDGVDFHLHVKSLSEMEEGLRFLRGRLPGKPMMVTEFSPIWLYMSRLGERLGDGPAGSDFARERGYRPDMTVLGFVNAARENPVAQAEWHDFLASRAWFDPLFISKAADLMRRYGVARAAYGFSQTCPGKKKDPAPMTEEDVPWLFNPLYVGGVVQESGGLAPVNYGFFADWTRWQLGQPPSVPGDLRAVSAGSTTLRLAWSPSEDNLGVKGYQVGRCSGASCSDFRPVAFTAQAGISDSGLLPATTYRYRVRAADLQENWSGFAGLSAATRMPEGPSSRIEVRLASPGPSSVVKGTAAVEAEVKGANGPARVEFLVDGVLRSTDSSAPYEWSWDTAKVSNGVHVLSVRAFDSAGSSAGARAEVVALNIPASCPSPAATSAAVNAGDFLAGAGADQGAGLQAAADWLGFQIGCSSGKKGALRFPAGKFRLGSKQMVFSEPSGAGWKGLSIAGEGAAQSVLQSGNAQGILGIVFKSPGFEAEIRGLGFDPEREGGGGVAVEVAGPAVARSGSQTRSLVMEDVQIGDPNPLNPDSNPPFRFFSTGVKGPGALETAS